MNKRIIFTAASASVILSACATTGANTQMTGSQNSQAAIIESDGETVTMEEVVSGRDTVGMDDDRIICRRRIVTGTRFKKNICRTWGEWKLIEEQSKNAATAIQRKRGQGDPEAFN